MITPEFIVTQIDARLETKALTNIPSTEQRELLLEKLIVNEAAHVKVMTVAVTRMFEMIADEFRIYLDQEGFKNKQIKARITNVRKLRPHIEQIVKRHLQSNITDVVSAGAEGTRSVLGTSFGLTNDEAVKFASKYTSKLAGEIAGSSVATVRSIISEGIKNGTPVNEVRNQLEGLFAGWSSARAETVARTETLRAYNMGSLEVLKKGGVEYKQWIAAPDACGDCLSLHEEVYPVEDTFMNKGDVFSTPDKSPHKNTYMSIPTPPVHPRCRCAIGGIPGELVNEYSQDLPSGLSLEKSAEFIRGMRKEAMRHLAGGKLAKDWEPAIGEALQNAIRYGGRKPFNMTIRRVGDRVSIYIRDFGRGFVPTTEQWLMPGATASGSRGLATMNLLSDSVAIQKLANGGTLVRLTKNVPQVAFPMPTSSSFNLATEKSVVASLKKQITTTWEGSRKYYGQNALFQATDSKYVTYKEGVRGIAMHDGDELVGMASSYEGSTNTTHLAFLATKRSGYGAHMMRQIAKEAVVAGSDGLSVAASIDAVGFYEKIGMKHMGNQIYFWTKKEVAAYAAGG